MDKYQKLKAIQGLIISLDEQIYRYDQKGEMSKQFQDNLVNSYYKSIFEFLQKEEDVLSSRIKPDQIKLGD